MITSEIQNENWLEINTILVIMENSMEGLQKNKIRTVIWSSNLTGNERKTKETNSASRIGTARAWGETWGTLWPWPGLGPRRSDLLSGQGRGHKMHWPSQPEATQESGATPPICAWRNICAALGPGPAPEVTPAGYWLIAPCLEVGVVITIVLQETASERRHLPENAQQPKSDYLKSQLLPHTKD